MNEDPAPRLRPASTGMDAATRGLLATLFCAWSACMNPVALAATPPSVPGVSLELAQWRAQRYSNVRYALDIELREGADRLRGRLELRVRLARDGTGQVPDLILDWRSTSPQSRLDELEVNGKAHAVRVANEHLVISADALRAGENLIRVAFEAPVAAAGAAVTRFADREDGSEYLYTLFVPADASSVFPCFDQPDLKARFRLTLGLPRHWTAISNAPLAASAPGRITFAATSPLSTYLFAFAAGPFEALAAPGDATRLYVRRSQIQKARQEVAEVLRLNRASMGYFANYFGRRYPFTKYDLVLIPEFAYGGMEHAGATFLNEQSVLFASTPSQTDQLRRAQLIFHEAAHQWFGNLVGMRWFDDLWLKEGFANFMASKAAAELTSHDAWSAFHALKTRAYRTDVTAGSTPIYRPIGNLSAAKSSYGSIVYAKAPAILRQAEFYLGREAFERAVRDFVKRHAHGSADWNDLLASFERASGKSMRGWAEAWVKRPGLPQVRARWIRDADDRIAELVLSQIDTRNEGRWWPLLLEVAAGNDTGVQRTAKVLLSGESVGVRALSGTPATRWVYPNAGDYGYARFLLDSASRDALLAAPAGSLPKLLRAQLIEALWEAVRDSELAPLQFIDHALSVARTADLDEVTLVGLLGRIETAFRHYLSDAQRDAVAPQVEGLLQAAMLNSAAQSRRITHLRAFSRLAWSVQGLRELKRLLDGDLVVPDVKLSSRDRFRIIERLLVRGDSEAHRRLAAQAAADRSGEGRRYAFAASSADPDAGAKRAQFEHFLNDAQLAESWIEAAVAPLNSVEHAAATRDLLSRALDELPRLKRSRKIFFVDAWLAAFIGGQTEARGLAEVRDFLRRTDLDEDLRLKVLEYADDYERTVKIVDRFARQADDGGGGR